MNHFQESLLQFGDNIETIGKYGKPISKRNTEAMIFSLKKTTIEALKRGDKLGASGVSGAIKLIEDAIEEGQFNSEKLASILGIAFIELSKALDTDKSEDFKSEVKNCITALIAVANLLSKDIAEESGERVSE